jgi:hypothetical protein
LYRFLAITVLLDVKDIPQVGPLQWGWISQPGRSKRVGGEPCGIAYLETSPKSVRPANFLLIAQPVNLHS